MAKKKENETPKVLVFTTSGTLPDGTDFEAGAPVPVDLSAADLESLRENGAVSEAN